MYANSRAFYDKRISAEVPGDSLGDEFKGYVFRITGGNDKQGFPMKQGVLRNDRVKLLLSKGHSCYRPRRPGERKRKSVRGCIVGSDLSVLSLVVVKKGEQDIPGLTYTSVPKRLGPKRSSKIRKFFVRIHHKFDVPSHNTYIFFVISFFVFFGNFFLGVHFFLFDLQNLTKQDDVRKFVIRREIKPKNADKKPYTKAPKIQRLVTPLTLQRKRHRAALKRRRAQASRAAAEEYTQLLARRVKEQKERKADLKKRRSSIRKD